MCSRKCVKIKTPRQNLNVISLDAQKAFDVVHHSIFKHGIYSSDLPRDHQEAIMATMKNLWCGTGTLAGTTTPCKESNKEESSPPECTSSISIPFCKQLSLYGLDAVVLNKQETENVNIFHPYLLCQIQDLYDSTANMAVYLLSGTIPVEADLHKWTLCLFGQVTR